MEEAYRNIIEGMQTPVCIFDHFGGIVYSNLSLNKIISEDELDSIVNDINLQRSESKYNNVPLLIGGFKYKIAVTEIKNNDAQLLLAEFISLNHEERDNFHSSRIAAVREINNTIVSANHAFEELIGRKFSFDEHVTLSSIFYPAELEKINSFKTSSDENPKDKILKTVHLKSKKNSNLICQVRIEPKEDANLYMFWDVTSILEKNDELIKEHNRLLKLLDTIPVMLFAIDHNDNLIFWNSTAQRWTGLDRHEALNNNWRNVFNQFAPENFLNKELFRDLEDKLEVSNRELEINRQDGRIVLSFTTFKKDIPLANISYWGIATDITEAKMVQEEHEQLIEELTASRDTITKDAFRAISLNERLADSEEQLRQANATKDKFFSIIAHDLKSPIHSFTSLTGLIIKEFDDLDKEETLELLQAILKSAKHLTSLLENLLQWSRTQSNRITLQPENIHLDQLIQHNISLLEQNAANKNIVLEHKKFGNQIAYADENMIYTVLRNLITNAIKFTHPGGKILILSKGCSETVEVSVIDNGVGMRKEDIDNLFRIDIYHSTVGTQQEKGTGLGLILCNEFMQKNQGKMTVESEIGKGSTFKFELPIGNNVKIQESEAVCLCQEMGREDICDAILAEHHPVLKPDWTSMDKSVIENIHKILIPQAKDLLSTMLIDDIADFARKIKRIAEQNSSIQLADFAIKLENSCENFDLIEIETSLNMLITLDK